MKKFIFMMAVAFCLPFISIAQKVEIAPFGGYVFGGTLNGDYGEVHINDNAQYGNMMSIDVSRGSEVLPE
jgi:hypothetical protein